MTRAAGVPASVVDLVTKVGEVQARYDLGVGRAGRVNIHGSKVVRSGLVWYNTGQVHQLLTSTRPVGLPG